ncbi:hypothetical protein ZWY2020_005298 [Hordeum vulgare]|nr:hypothetical protein ZWY2020_005298 [Hordeum vulgare]
MLCFSVELGRSLKNPYTSVQIRPTAARAAPRLLRPLPLLSTDRLLLAPGRPSTEASPQRATATSGYDPSLLRGVSYKVEDSDDDSPVRVVQPVPADEQQRLHSPAAAAQVRSGTSSSISKTVIGHPNIVPVLSILHPISSSINFGYMCWRKL